jgi:hypothetical protein
MALDQVLGILIGTLLALVLLKYSGFLDKIKRSAAIIAAGTLFYIVDLAWNASALVTRIPANTAVWVTFTWELVAFVLIIVGVIWSAIELITKK